MISRVGLKHGGNLGIRHASAPAASSELERNGFALVPAVFSPQEVSTLRSEMTELFETTHPDVRLPGSTEEDYTDFRYEVLNRSAAAQRAVADVGLLEVIEPLLGEDCHVVSNTAWRNSPQRAKAPFDVGNPWHVDTGPHVPDLLLRSVSKVTSCFFVSDVWHPRMPTGPDGAGRFFLQVQYGRSDIAPRLRTTDVANHLSSDAVARAVSQRERTVVGLHPAGFYDG